MPEARPNRKASPPSFPALVQQFFTEYLVAQRALSPRTVACYRDAMTLFLGYVTQHLGKPPMAMQLMDITPEVILKFLAHLERERHNSVRSSQPAADRLAGVPEVRRPTRRDGAARRRARDGRADEALRATTAGPPDASGDDRRDGATRHRVDFAARPSAAEPAVQHRRARVGDRRGARRRRGAGRRGLRASARQGPQGSVGAVVEVDRVGHPRLAARQPATAWFGGIAAQSIRPSDDPLQHGAATGVARWTGPRSISRA